MRSRREADLVDPELLGLVVADVDGDPHAVGVEPERSGEQLPRPADGLGLEVVAEAPVAEHLEEAEVPGGAADGVEVVVLAAGPHALLRVGHPGRSYGSGSSPRKYGTTPSPTSWAAWRCCSGASSRCSPSWPSPARPSTKRVAPAGLGTMRTDTPTFAVLLTSSPCCSSAPSRSSPRCCSGPSSSLSRILVFSEMRKEPHPRGAGPRSPSRWLLGLVYPLVITGIAQVAFPGKADGVTAR